MTEILGARCRLRPWQPGDESALVKHADDREIWRNLADFFPHPYTRDDADAWIARCQTQAGPTRNFAIEVEGEPVGGIGMEPLTDIARKTGRVGYWVGRALWGRGIATEALILLTDHAFARFDLVRLEAEVIDWNHASERVLEKAGYVLESRRLCRVFKDGKIADSLLYVRLRSED